MPRRSYWTLASHPARFRVVDSVRNLDEDWWLTGGADLHKGDRVAIWKYKGRDDHRGIITFGEVLTDPEPHELTDSDRKYWIDRNVMTAAPRVLVRYAIKLAEPLWFENASPESVIRQLPVSRAQGGTAHHVTFEQWDQLMDLAGGWPSSDVDQDAEAPGWPHKEIQPTVTAYFAMLRSELSGQSYVKVAFNREVQAATGRSRGAVEFKFANISAVLRDIGLPYVHGYQPRGNYQAALYSEVESFLETDPEIVRLVSEVPAPEVPQAAKLEEAAPPAMSPTSASGRRRIVADINYLELQERNRDIGLKGELLVVDYERAWLKANGCPGLAEQVAHVPGTLGDGAGYDVSSFLLDGTPHRIEVKTTRGSINVPFYMSANELRFALEYAGAYSIYRVFDLGPTPGLYKLTGDMKEILDLTPVSYRVRIKAPGTQSSAQG